MSKSKGFKIAISGKGGVGKSTLAAMLAHLAARDGLRVLAIDADPDANLAAALGMGSEERAKIVPLAHRRALVEGRTGAKVRQYGQIFRLNPEVSDIADNESTPFRGIHLLVLGAVASGGSGCACPENVLLRALLGDVILHRDDCVVLDLEAGFEHLGRATAQGVDLLLVVAEPSLQSVETAATVRRMAAQIGLHKVGLVGNKIVDAQDQAFIDEQIGQDEAYIDSLPFDNVIRRAHRQGQPLLDAAGEKTLERFDALWTKIRERMDAEH